MRWYQCLILCLLILIISGCSSTPNSLGVIESENENKEWTNVLGSLSPSDPVPKEIKLESGNYIVASVENIRDGDSITISNVDTTYIEDKDIKENIKKVMDSNMGKLGVRMISIDTPEITNGKNEHFGDKAKEAVQRLLHNGQVYLELDPKALFDNYDRLLAHVYTTKGVSVQKSLLSNGLARTAYLYDDYKYTKDYKHAEEEAVIKKLNIYSIEGYVKTDEIAGFV